MRNLQFILSVRRENLHFITKLSKRNSNYKSLCSGWLWWGLDLNFWHSQSSNPKASIPIEFLFSYTHIKIYFSSLAENVIKNPENLSLHNSSFFCIYYTDKYFKILTTN